MTRRIDLPADPVVCRHCGKEFRAIMFLHLRWKHHYRGDHPVLSYKRRFGLAIAMCDVSREKIRAARNEFWEERGQRWTRKRVITAIKKRHRKHQSLRRNLVPAALHDAACRLFGTWRAAIEKAGLNYDHIRILRQWSRKKVIKYVQELAAQGIPITSKHIKEHYPYLYSAGIKKFPRSWSKVLRAAGFDPAEHKVPPDKWDQVSAEAAGEKGIDPGPGCAKQVISVCPRATQDELGGLPGVARHFRSRQPQSTPMEQENGDFGNPATKGGRLHAQLPVGCAGRSIAHRARSEILWVMGRRSRGSACVRPKGRSILDLAFLPRIATARDGSRPTMMLVLQEQIHREQQNRENKLDLPLDFKVVNPKSLGRTSPRWKVIGESEPVAPVSLAPTPLPPSLFPLMNEIKCFLQYSPVHGLEARC